MTETAPETILLTPGPTPLPPEVREATGRQMMNHRGPEFGRMMAEILAGLHEVFQTRHDIIPLVSSGTGGLEATIVNFLSPGDRVLSVNNGHFCERFAEIAEQYGVHVDRVTAEWGKPAPVDAVAARVRSEGPDAYRAVLVTHSETSTGVHNDIPAIRAALGDSSALLFVDAISSMGAMPLATDALGVDVAVTASQKALMSPPGMAFVSVSDRAWAAAERAAAPRFYFDLRRGRTQIHTPRPTTPFTTAVGIVYAVHAALRLIHAEGLDRVYDRHRRMARVVRAGVRGMGLSTLADDAYAADSATAVRIPDGIDAAVVASHAQDKYGVVFGGGIRRLEHTVIRIGHMGHTRVEWLLDGLRALGRTLQDLGYAARTDAGVDAARQTLAAAAKR